MGKRAAIAEANKSIRKTLRPCKDESKNWDTTENLYIEGDNLEVLKLLQESYLGKVKMIYIDPPYNTGNDFIYRDDFKQTQQEYEEQAGLFDEEENRLFKNTETNGRFHSDWCSMMYSRLMLAKNFLSDDGIIFISIDDNEVANLRKLCNDVFGESNFIAQINWKARGGRQDSKYFAVIHEYILCFALNIRKFMAGEDIKLNDIYPKFDEKKNKYYKTQLLRKWGSNSRKEDRPNLFYPINAPDGSLLYPMLKPLAENEKNKFPNTGKEGCWRWGKKTMKIALENDNVEFLQQEDKTWIAYEKIYKPENGEEKTKKYITWIDDISNGTNEIKYLFNISIFDYPKSTKLIEQFIKMANLDKEDIAMDFFSGSATSAHAVMQLNAEDGGHRKFIMVQLPEVCDEKSEAYKAGYKNICEIGKERLRRAGEKIKADNPLTTQDLDIGFRVFKVDSSNMNDVYYSAGEYSQDMLVNLEDNIKPDRTDLDLLFGCLLDWGLPISLPYTSEQIENCTVHTYNDGDLVACFDENIPESVIKEIAKRKPLRAVFRDAGFGSSPEKINVTEIFKMLAPDTDVKVI